MNEVDEASEEINKENIWSQNKRGMRDRSLRPDRTEMGSRMIWNSLFRNAFTVQIYSCTLMLYGIAVKK